jgi:Arc/MetJ-type ribon-helix-helix transcriptional regulator
MEPAATDRIQRMIDAEAAERFPPGAVPQLTLLHHGDHPFIEPGELYLLVILGQDDAARDAWWAAHSGRLEEFRAQRLPEVKGFMATTGARVSAGRPPTQIRQPTGISLLDPEEDEIARGLTAVTAHFGPADLATLDALITAGIAASRAEAARWALARIREQPAYAQLSESSREPSEPSEQDLTPVPIRLGPADLEMLDALIATGTAASRAEAISWVLARIREQPAYARLSERARELDQLKAHF